MASDGKELLYGVDAQHLMVLNSGSDLPVIFKILKFYKTLSSNRAHTDALVTYFDLDMLFC